MGAGSSLQTGFPIHPSLQKFMNMTEVEYQTQVARAPFHKHHLNFDHVLFKLIPIIWHIKAARPWWEQWVLRKIYEETGVRCFTYREVSYVLKQLPANLEKPWLSSFFKWYYKEGYPLPYWEVGDQIMRVMDQPVDVKQPFVMNDSYLNENFEKHFGVWLNAQADEKENGYYKTFVDNQGRNMLRRVVPFEQPQNVRLTYGYENEESMELVLVYYERQPNNTLKRLDFPVYEAPEGWENRTPTLKPLLYAYCNTMYQSEVTDKMSHLLLRHFKDINAVMHFLDSPENDTEFMWDYLRKLDSLKPPGPQRLEEIMEFMDEKDVTQFQKRYFVGDLAVLNDDTMEQRMEIENLKDDFRETLNLQYTFAYWKQYGERPNWIYRYQEKPENPSHILASLNVRMSYKMVHGQKIHFPFEYNKVREQSWVPRMSFAEQNITLNHLRGLVSNWEQAEQVYHLDFKTTENGFNEFMYLRQHPEVLQEGLPDIQNFKCLLSLCNSNFSITGDDLMTGDISTMITFYAHKKFKCMQMSEIWDKVYDSRNIRVVWSWAPHKSTEDMLYVYEEMSKPDHPRHDDYERSLQGLWWDVDTSSFELMQLQLHGASYLVSLNSIKIHLQHMRKVFPAFRLVQVRDKVLRWGNEYGSRGESEEHAQIEKNTPFYEIEPIPLDELIQLCQRRQPESKREDENDDDEEEKDTLSKEKVVHYVRERCIITFPETKFEPKNKDKEDEEREEWEEQLERRIMGIARHFQGEDKYEMKTFSYFKIVVTCLKYVNEAEWKRNLSGLRTRTLIPSFKGMQIKQVMLQPPTYTPGMVSFAEWSDSANGHEGRPLIYRALMTKMKLEEVRGEPYYMMYMLLEHPIHAETYLHDSPQFIALTEQIMRTRKITYDQMKRFFFVPGAVNPEEARHFAAVPRAWEGKQLDIDTLEMENYIPINAIMVEDDLGFSSDSEDEGYDGPNDFLPFNSHIEEARQEWIPFDANPEEPMERGRELDFGSDSEEEEDEQLHLG